MSASNISAPSDEMTSSGDPVEDAFAESPAPEPDRAAILENEVGALKDQLLRHRADFANYKRRVERELRASGEDAIISLLGDLLPSLDALEKALSAKGTVAEIRTGVEITLKEVSTTLAGRGVKIEDPVGEKFDPLRHQALSYEPVLGAEDGAIVACYRKGYLLGEKLIRPALVKVAQQATEEHPSVVVPLSN